MVSPPDILRMTCIALLGGVGDSRGHHGTTLGMPRTHEWYSSKHTWVPRHVWRAPHGHNSMGHGATYLLLVLAQGHLSLVRRVSWRSHGRNPMV